MFGISALLGVENIRLLHVFHVTFATRALDHIRVTLLLKRDKCKTDQCATKHETLIILFDFPDLTSANICLNFRPIN